MIFQAITQAEIFILNGSPDDHEEVVFDEDDEEENEDDEEEEDSDDENCNGPSVGCATQ